MASPSTITSYPSSLPNPANSLMFAPVERRFKFGENRATRMRAFEEGFRAFVRLEFLYTGAQAAIFRDWWEVDLELGLKKFVAYWPNPEGFVAATYRFRPNTVEWKHLGFEVFSVAGECSVGIAQEIFT